jgi:glycosyltransferase involved in cell wall biosynthesis
MQPGSPTVGFVIDNLGLGGAQKQLALLAAALPPRVSARVYVLSALDQPHGRALRAHQIPVTTIARRSHVDVARLVSLTRALSKDRVDVVHGFLDAANVYAFLAARRLHAPVVLSLRSQKLTMPGPRAHVLRWMMQRADAVTTNSEAGRRYLMENLRVPRERVHRVPNIVVVPESAGTPATPPVVGCVGRLVEIKRFDEVLRAFSLVRAAVPSGRLEIVGDGPQQGALRALAQRLGILASVDFVGAVDDATPRIARMSCVVVASAFEGLPNIVLEAMSLGVPVVVPPVGDLQAVVEDGVTGIVVDDPTPASLAPAIVRALSDASLRARAREQGPRVVRAQFSTSAALQVLVPLYERLSKRTGAAAWEATTPVLGE